jgi:hypothetical protein
MASATLNGGCVPGYCSANDRTWFVGNVIDAIACSRFCYSLLDEVAAVVVALNLSVGTAIAQSAIARIYIEERVQKIGAVNVHCDAYGNCYGQNTSATRNVSLQVTRELTKTCRAVMVTDSREAADYVLCIAPGASTLYQQNGDVAYVSPARFRVSNLAKDVCGYISSHPK